MNLADIEKDWPLGSFVTKKSGTSWTGKIVGYYSTSKNPSGVCIECRDRACRSSVQIYPTTAVVRL